MSPPDDMRPETPKPPARRARGSARLDAGARRAIGSAILLAYLLIYVVLAASLGSALAAAPAWLLLAFYAGAGFAWIVPLYPLFVWMRGPRAGPGR
jgi:hypothetical protein